MSTYTVKHRDNGLGVDQIEAERLDGTSQSTDSYTLKNNNGKTVAVIPKASVASIIRTQD